MMKSLMCLIVAAPNLNRFATKDSEFAKTVVTKNPQLLVKLAPSDITANPTVLTVEGFRFSPSDKRLITSGKLTAPANAQVKEEAREPYSLTPSWEPVANADYYEIQFDGMIYSTIKGTEFLFEDLVPETSYSFDVRAVNKDGYSDWATTKATTKANPLEFAIPGIVGEASVPSQGNSLDKLFDFKEKDGWHTKHSQEAVPFDLIMDLKTINKLDKFHYIPREDAGNGTFLKGSVAYSMDKDKWVEAGTFEWPKDKEVKTFTFKDAPAARYIKINVTEGISKYGSGQEIYVFKVPGTESYLPGDINNDGKIDRNDLTSYTNYTGLRKGDSDFEGYISNGDINKNGLIDAYDISVVATQLNDDDEDEAVEEEDQAAEEAKKDDEKKEEKKDGDEKTEEKKVDQLDGKLVISTPKKDYSQGEIIEITVKGDNLNLVNALSFALPYNPADYEFVGVEPKNIQKMENLTNDRLHTNGTKALYPTFVNIGDKKTLQGSEDLFVLKFKAKRDLKFDLKPIDGMLVDRKLNSKKF